LFFAMNRAIRLIFVGAVAVLCAACASEPTCDYSDEPYMAAQNVGSLRAPQGLSTPETGSALTIPPEPPGGNRAAISKSRCLDRPPSYFSTSRAAGTDKDKTSGADKPADSDKPR
jgi:hypothetical protein